MAKGLKLAARICVPGKRAGISLLPDADECPIPDLDTMKFAARRNAAAIEGLSSGGLSPKDFQD
jgi:hypothetical protein